MQKRKSPVKPAPVKQKAAQQVVAPDYFLTALKQDKKALAAFQNSSPSHRREYLKWIAEAKREETRANRTHTAVEMLARGKSPK